MKALLMKILWPESTALSHHTSSVASKRSCPSITPSSTSYLSPAQSRGFSSDASGDNGSGDDDGTVIEKVTTKPNTDKPAAKSAAKSATKAAAKLTAKAGKGKGKSSTVKTKQSNKTIKNNKNKAGTLQKSNSSIKGKASIIATTAASLAAQQKDCPPVGYYFMSLPANSSTFHDFFEKNGWGINSHDVRTKGNLLIMSVAFCKENSREDSLIRVFRDQKLDLGSISMKKTTTYKDALQLCKKVEGWEKCHKVAQGTRYSKTR